jgi:hypothetical protein
MKAISQKWSTSMTIEMDLVIRTILRNHHLVRRAFERYRRNSQWASRLTVMRQPKRKLGGGALAKIRISLFTVSTMFSVSTVSRIAEKKQSALLICCSCIHTVVSGLLINRNHKNFPPPYSHNITVIQQDVCNYHHDQSIRAMQVLLYGSATLGTSLLFTEAPMTMTASDRWCNCTG